MAINPVFFSEIRQSPLFKHLSDTSFQLILHHSGIITLAKNELLFECGFEANHFFIMRSGQISFFQTSSDGNEKIVDIFESGQTFAETFIFSNDQCYPVNARATCETELFYFDAQSFKAQMQQSNELCFFMMSEMSNRLKQQTQEIIELSLHDAQHRLIRYLLEKSCQEGIQSCQPVVILSMTKSLLASRLSITPETFSRILTRLKKQGLITIRDDAITLKEPKELVELIGHCNSKILAKPKKSELKWTIKKEPTALFQLSPNRVNYSG